MFIKRNPCTNRRRCKMVKRKSKVKKKRKCGPCSRHPPRVQPKTQREAQLDFTFSSLPIMTDEVALQAEPQLESFFVTPTPTAPPITPRPSSPKPSKPKKQKKKKRVQFDVDEQIIRASPPLYGPETRPFVKSGPIRLPTFRPRPMYRPKLESIVEVEEVRIQPVPLQDVKADIRTSGEASVDWKIGEPVPMEIDVPSIDLSPPQPPPPVVRIPLDEIVPLRFRLPPPRRRPKPIKPTKLELKDFKLPPIRIRPPEPAPRPPQLPQPRPTQPKPQPKPQQPRPIQYISIPMNTVDRRSCELRFHNYTRRKQLGKGAFGTVFELCQDIKFGALHCPYVLKVQAIDATDKGLRLFTQEVRTQIIVHEKLGFTPAVYDVWYCDKRLRRPALTGFIIMERMDGDLVSYLERNARRLTNDFIRNLIQTMRMYVQKLHQLGITHNDIADRNIFFKRLQGGERVEFVLADWGFAGRVLDGKGTSRDVRMLQALEQQLLKIKQRGRYVSGM